MIDHNTLKNQSCGTGLAGRIHVIDAGPNNWKSARACDQQQPAERRDSGRGPSSTLAAESRS